MTNPAPSSIDAIRSTRASLIHIFRFAEKCEHEIEYPANEGFARIRSMAYEALGNPTKKEMARMEDGL